MRYVIDEERTEPEESRAMYGAAVRWAGARGGRYAMVLRPADYEDPAALARLRALGEESPGRGGEVRVHGIPDARLVQALTETKPPAGAEGGDLCPVVDVEIERQERRIYAAFDYGRTQVLELDADELAELRAAFAAAGADPDRIAPFPG